MANYGRHRSKRAEQLMDFYILHNNSDLNEMIRFEAKEIRLRQEKIRLMQEVIRRRGNGIMRSTQIQLDRMGRDKVNE